MKRQKEQDLAHSTHCDIDKKPSIFQRYKLISGTTDHQKEPFYTNNKVCPKNSVVIDLCTTIFTCHLCFNHNLSTCYDARPLTQTSIFRGGEKQCHCDNHGHKVNTFGVLTLWANRTPRSPPFFFLSFFFVWQVFLGSN